MSASKPARNKRKKAGTPAPDESPAAVINKKGLFAKDLAVMMYGFGDDIAPYKESVDLVEEMMTDFMIETMNKAMAASALKGGKPNTEDLLFLVRKDPRKYNRVKELLFLQKEIVQAKKGFDDKPPEEYE